MAASMEPKMPRFIVFKVTRALIARFLFAIHTLVAISILYAENRRIYYWAFAASPVLLFIEGMITIVFRHGDEYKWFCPSVFIFLCGSVPPIWLLELRTTWRAVHNITQSANPATDFGNMKWIGHVMFELPQLPAQMWFQVVEQSLLVILILGRWLLPKGRITRDELSQLLLAYLAISADIVELFNLFQERQVRMNKKLSIMVLAFWSVSLVQFPFVITTVKSQKARYCFVTTPVSHEPSPFASAVDQKVDADAPPWTWQRALRRRVCDVRVWGILSTILLQDLPFWVLRIYLIFWEHIMSYTMFFFICKNSLIMWIQLYRLIIICGEQKQAMAKEQEQRRSETPPKQMNMLHAEYSAAEKLEEFDKEPKEKILAPSQTNTQQQNGSVKTPPTISVSNEDARRSSFNITGTVSAKDLVAKQRNATMEAKKAKLGERTKLERIDEEAKKLRKDCTANIKPPTVRLASMDSLEDL